MERSSIEEPAAQGAIKELLAVWPKESVSQFKFDAGQHLFRQGQRANAIFVIVFGRIRLIRDLSDGTTVTLHSASNGETFAEAAFDASQYHCNAIADTDGEVLRLDCGSPETANASVELHSILNRVLANQVRELRAMVSLRDIRSAEERLLAWLRLRGPESGKLISIDETWTVIAQRIGLSREVVYRALASLEKNGVIERSTFHDDECKERLRLL